MPSLTTDKQKELKRLIAISLKNKKQAKSLQSLQQALTIDGISDYTYDDNRSLVSRASTLVALKRKESSESPARKTISKKEQAFIDLELTRHRLTQERRSVEMGLELIQAFELKRFASQSQLSDRPLKITEYGS